jgi:hypothetical protein
MRYYDAEGKVKFGRRQTESGQAELITPEAQRDNLTWIPVAPRHKIDAHSRCRTTTLAQSLLRMIIDIAFLVLYNKETS